MSPAHVFTQVDLRSSGILSEKLMRPRAALSQRGKVPDPHAPGAVTYQGALAVFGELHMVHFASGKVPAFLAALQVETADLPVVAPRQRAVESGETPAPDRRVPGFYRLKLLPAGCVPHSQRRVGAGGQ